MSGQFEWIKSMEQMESEMLDEWEREDNEKHERFLRLMEQKVRRQGAKHKPWYDINGHVAALQEALDASEWVDIAKKAESALEHIVGLYGARYAREQALIAYARHCESEIARLAVMLEETHDQFIDESHEAMLEARHQYGVAELLEHEGDANDVLG